MLWSNDPQAGTLRPPSACHRPSGSTVWLRQALLAGSQTQTTGTVFQVQANSLEHSLQQSMMWMAWRAQAAGLPNLAPEASRNGGRKVRRILEGQHRTLGRSWSDSRGTAQHTDCGIQAEGPCGKQCHRLGPQSLARRTRLRTLLAFLPLKELWLVLLWSLSEGGDLASLCTFSRRPAHLLYMSMEK